MPAYIIKYVPKIYLRRDILLISDYEIQFYSRRNLAIFFSKKRLIKYSQFIFFTHHDRYPRTSLRRFGEPGIGGYSRKGICNPFSTHRVW